MTAKVNRLLAKYPNSIPIVVEVDKSLTLKDSARLKYLYPKGDDMARFVCLFRERNIKLHGSEGLFWFCNNKVILLSQTAGQLWREENKDGILYIKVYKENVFG